MEIYSVHVICIKIHKISKLDIWYLKDEINFYLSSISLIVFIKISIYTNICNLATEAFV